MREKLKREGKGREKKKKKRKKAVGVPGLWLFLPRGLSLFYSMVVILSPPSKIFVLEN